MFKPASVYLLGIVLLSTSMSSLAKADIAIIANKSSSIDKLQSEQVQKLWLGKIHKLPGIGKIKVVDQTSNNPIKEEFYEKLTHKNMGQLKVYWAKIIFTGKALPPKALSSDKKVLEMVSKEKNILGYINSKSVTNDIKVLMTIK